MDRNETNIGFSKARVYGAAKLSNTGAYFTMVTWPNSLTTVLLTDRATIR